MPTQLYKRPPITEAVIEIRFESPVDSVALDKSSSDLRVSYAREDLLQGTQFELYPTAGSAPAKTMNQKGYRLSSLDQTEILILMPMPPSFLISQLAPYPGWTSFFDRFQRDWSVWKKAVGYRKIQRIGVRYINRIDIPSTDPVICQEQFLNIHPNVPDVLGLVMQSTVQLRLFIEDFGGSLTINTSAVPSPLIDHMSFVVDIDVGKDNPVQSDEDIYELLNQMRVIKNRVFETCVTDRARELFEPWPQ